MLKNNKLLIILISVFLALVIGITTVLLVVVNTSSAGSSDNTQTEDNDSNSDNINENLSKEFTVEVYNTLFTSGSTNNLGVAVGKNLNFNITGVGSYNDYECKVIGFLPSTEYNFVIPLTYGDIRKKNLFSVDSSKFDNDETSIILGNYDYTDGFDLLKSNDSFTFLMEYDSIDSFIDSFFGRDIDVHPFGNCPKGEELLNDISTAHTFKLEVRKISTDELISFVLTFKN